VSYYRDNILLNKFGVHLRNLRIRNGLSQEELAYESDLDISQIGRIERGVVNTCLCVLQRLAKALNISLKDLLDF
jgi:transcriptional regulator with XRE-family HTH domain